MDRLAVIAAIGGIALLIGILGGGIEAERIKIPSIPVKVRILSGVIGIILLGIALIPDLPISGKASALTATPPAPTATLPAPTATPPAPTLEPTDVPIQTVASLGQYHVLIDTYHGGDFFQGSQTALLQKSGYAFENAASALTDEELSRFDILIIDFANYADGKENFSKDEFTSTRRYINQGGSVLLNGLGWVWTQYGNQPIEEYPLNIIANDYGCYFNSDYVWNVVGDTSPVFYTPFMDMKHQITQGVNRLADDPSAVPGSFEISSLAIPIIWGDENVEGGTDDLRKRSPVVLAAATFGEGKIVCSQIGGYITNPSTDYDGLRLLENILMWLTSK